MRPCLAPPLAPRGRRQQRGAAAPTAAPPAPTLGGDTPVAGSKRGRACRGGGTGGTATGARPVPRRGSSPAAPRAPPRRPPPGVVPQINPFVVSSPPGALARAQPRHGARPYSHKVTPSCRSLPLPLLLPPLFTFLAADWGDGSCRAAPPTYPCLTAPPVHSHLLDMNYKG